MLSNTKRQISFLSVFLSAITLIIYWPSLHNEFINYDDPSYVTENAYVRNGLTLQSIAWAFQGSHVSNWHPLTWLSHMLDCQFYGLNPFGHHLTNLLFHTANTVLLFLLLQRLTGAIGKSTLVAALFAWHPLHIESVAWIAERKDVLSTFFWLLTLLSYVRYVKRQDKWAYILSLVFFSLGLMSKPMLVTLPFVLILLDYWPLSRFSITGIKRTYFRFFVWEKLPFFILAGITCILTILAQRTGGAVMPVEFLSVNARIANALISYVRYIEKMLWPAELSIFYPHPSMWPLWIITGAIVGLIAITTIVILTLRSRPYLAVGWFWYLGTLVPVIGLVQVGGQAMADRYSYIPLIGLFIALVWGLNDIFVSWKVPLLLWRVASVVPLSACIIFTVMQLRHWQNSQTLFEHALAITTENFSAHFSLGNALIEKGKPDEGLVHLKEALRLAPNFPEVHGKIGLVLAGEGKFKEATDFYRKALSLKPDIPEALNNLSWILATTPDPQIRNGAEAVRLAERACELTRNEQPMMLGTLAAAYAETGRFSEAIATAKKAENLALSLGQKQLAETNQKLIELYQAGKPYRDSPSSN